MPQGNTPSVDGIEYEPESHTYRVTFDCETESPSRVLIRAVARIEGQDALELPPLYDQVDPVALDSVVCRGRVRHSRSDIEVSLQYCGYDVRVCADGNIDIQEAAGSGADIDHTTDLRESET